MLQATEFKYQGIVAFAAISFGEIRASAVLRRVMQLWPKIYDGEVLGFGFLSSWILPPPEVPLAAVSSSEGANSIEVSRTSVIVRWLRKQDVEPNLKALLVEFAGRLATIHEGENTKIGRIGAAITRQAATAESPSDIAKKFTRSDVLQTLGSKPESFELHLHNIIPIVKDLRANSWTRIRTSRQTGKETQVVVDQDINSLAEESGAHQFLRDDLVAVFNAAAEEFDKILVRSFPRAE